jgi:hypothetical protein
MPVRVTSQKWHLTWLIAFEARLSRGRKDTAARGFWKFA